MKICFFIGNMSHAGGTERVLATVANGLSGRGYSVFVVSLWGEGQTFFPLSEEVNLYWLQEKAHPFDVIGQLGCLSAILTREKPDFLVDVDIILAFYSFFLKKRNPGIYWVSWEHFNFYHPFEKNRLLRILARRIVCRSADELIVLTDGDEENYRRNMKMKSGITRIYNPLPYREKAIRRTEEPVILAVGRLTGVKGYDLLIRSWKLLESDYPDWSVIVIGEGEDRRILEQLSKEEGLARLYFIGERDPVEEYYEKAAFLVLPSRGEGFGMVLIEAMYYSLPVVSYSCESGPAEIVEDGETGFLVEPGDTVAFARKMEVLIRDKELRRKMGERAQRSVGRFDREEILNQWERMLESLSALK